MVTPDPRAEAVPLLCPSDQLGRCARCQQTCQRYGVGGNPLCVACLAAVGKAQQKGAGG
ncbi:hypothetical protein AB0G85_38480 [Streptomyces sioyaensis]|uniref:hypothetical protein n=1 Tax=Streptomyces sioyaensis TaxID=67364 RepID=UPI0033F60FC3